MTWYITEQALRLVPCSTGKYANAPNTNMMYNFDEWETPLKQNYRLTAVICSSEIELAVAKKFRTRLSNPIQIWLSIIYKIQIHHKV